MMQVGEGAGAVGMSRRSSGETILVTHWDRVVAELVPPREGRSPGWPTRFSPMRCVRAGSRPPSAAAPGSRPGCRWHRCVRSSERSTPTGPPSRPSGSRLTPPRARARPPSGRRTRGRPTGGGRARFAASRTPPRPPRRRDRWAGRAGPRRRAARRGETGPRGRPPRRSPPGKRRDHSRDQRGLGRDLPVPDRQRAVTVSLAGEARRHGAMHRSGRRRFGASRRRATGR